MSGREWKKKTRKRVTAFKLENGRCFRISNVKIRFKTDRPFDNVKKLIADLSLIFGVTTYGNTFTVRAGDCVFICLFSGNINATGFASLDDIPQILELFSLIFPTYLNQPEGTDFIIDNISLFGRVGKRVFSQFPHDVSIFEDRPARKYSFNNFSFPGATLKGEKGTLVIFATGSVIVLGIKSEAAFPLFRSLLNYMIRNKGRLLTRPKEEVISLQF